jgi:hypothetical protein
MIATLGVYLFLTMMVGGMRLLNISDKNNGKTMVDLWNTGYYSFFSICQKLGEFIHISFLPVRDLRIVMQMNLNV